MKVVHKIRSIKLKDIYLRLNKAGAKVIYPALLLVYAYRRKETPRWAKAAILGTLSYFLAPIDAIPDLTPFLGYTDDYAMIIGSLASIALYINDEVKEKAQTKLKLWLPDYNIDTIEAVVSEDIKNT